MLTGAQVFEGFDDAQRRAAAEADAAERELAALTARLDTLRGDEAAALRGLAQLHLGALRDGAAPLARLDAADARVRAAIDARRDAVAAADRLTAERDAAVAGARVVAHAAAAALAAAEQQAATAMAASRERAGADPEWQRLSAVATEAQRTASLARQKASLAAMDQAEKGKPYRDDPLFRYLWDRGFGTAAYRAGPLVRAIDGWVARIVAFEPARRSFALLTGLPARLAEHADRMEATLAAATDALAAHEAALGGAPPATELARLRVAHDAAEDALEAAEAAASEAALDRATRGGGDAAEREAIAALEAALGETSLRALRDAAARTPTRDDDALVARLEAAATERERLDWRIGEQRRLAAEARQRLDRLTETRGAARRQGYGSGGFDFGTGAVLGTILGEVVRGTMDRGGFLDRMQRSRAPGPWGGGSRGGGGFGGDGGFSTGGRIEGGGGFKTGGSF